MGRRQEKVSPSDLKYDAIASMMNPHSATAIATIKHRKRGRVRNRLNAAKFESKRSGDSRAYVEAGVNEIMKILGV